MTAPTLGVALETGWPARPAHFQRDHLPVFNVVNT